MAWVGLVVAATGVMEVLRWRERRGGEGARQAVWGALLGGRGGATARDFVELSSVNQDAGIVY